MPTASQHIPRAKRTIWPAKMDVLVFLSISLQICVVIAILAICEFLIHIDLTRHGLFVPVHVNEDLESLDKKIVLEDIDHLKLGPDIDRETVNRYIEVIKDVDELIVPRSIFMLILTKARDCEEVSKY